MALRAIIVDGDEVLRKKSKEVKNFGERTCTLLDDMWETMREADGVGLAAPQVGVLRRAVVIDVTDPESKDTGEGREADASEATGASATADASEATGKPGETEASGTKAAESADGGEGVAPVPAELPVNAPGGFLYELLNPSIIESVGESVEREGCLSVPGVSGLVKRPERVTVKASDRDGNEIIVKGEGILAKALCHEIDHLEGVLFTDIAEEMETLGTREPGEQEESE